MNQVQELNIMDVVVRYEYGISLVPVCIRLVIDPINLVIQLGSPMQKHKSDDKGERLKSYHKNTENKWTDELIVNQTNKSTKHNLVY